MEKFIETVRDYKYLFITMFVVNFTVLVIFFLLLLGVVGAQNPLSNNQNLQTLPEESDITNFLSQHIHSEQSVVVPVVERVNPAVVSIAVTKDVSRLEREERVERFGPFDIIIPQYREDGVEEIEIGGGSGFLVSSDGLVVTNQHVVREEDATYTVFTNDGQSYVADVVARDQFLDLAVLRIEGEEGFPFLSFGSSDDLRLGETVIAIGNALGEFRNSVSVGVVSGLSRTIIAGDRMGRTQLLEEVIQTDAAINLGNSGGPLINTKGEVVGVNVARVFSGESIGFSLPSDLVKGAVDSVREHGEIIRPFIGVRYVQINNRVMVENDLPVDYGVLIIRGRTANDPAVIPNSPASEAGLREGDIVLSIDGVELREDGPSLGIILRQREVGDTVVLEILRDGESSEVEMQLDRAPSEI